MENNKLLRKQKPLIKEGYCKPCFSKITTFAVIMSYQPQLLKAMSLFKFAVYFII